jgi:hypothetical protein
VEVLDDLLHQVPQVLLVRVILEHLVQGQSHIMQVVVVVRVQLLQV